MENHLREAKESINMDDGIVINLDKVPDKVKCIILMNKISEVDKLRLET